MSRLDVFPLPARAVNGGPVIITSPFGPRGGGFHAGVDLGAERGIDLGTPVHAPADGSVFKIKNDGPFVHPNKHTAGLNLWFLADDGRRWKMFHLNKVVVAEKQHVTAGTQIAEVGKSGTKDVHLHFECHDREGFDHAVDHNEDVREALRADGSPVRHHFEGNSGSGAGGPVTPTPSYLEALMIRNDSDGGIFILGTKDGRPAWILLNGDEVQALAKLGVTNLESVGKGDNERDKAFSVFQR